MQKFGVWLRFQNLVMLHAFRKVGLTFGSSLIEMLWKSDLSSVLYLPKSKEKYFSTVENFIQKTSQREKLRMGGLMHLLDSYANILALSLLSSLKSSSHISGEYCNNCYLLCFQTITPGRFQQLKKYWFFCPLCFLSSEATEKFSLLF